MTDLSGNPETTKCECCYEWFDDGQIDDNRLHCSHYDDVCCYSKDDDVATIYGQCLYCVFDTGEFGVEYDCFDETTLRGMEIYTAGLNDGRRGKAYITCVDDAHHHFEDTANLYLTGVEAGKKLVEIDELQAKIIRLRSNAHRKEGSFGCTKDSSMESYHKTGLEIATSDTLKELASRASVCDSAVSCVKLLADTLHIVYENTHVTGVALQCHGSKPSHDDDTGYEPDDYHDKVFEHFRYGGSCGENGENGSNVLMITMSCNDPHVTSACSCFANPSSTTMVPSTACTIPLPHFVNALHLERFQVSFMVRSNKILFCFPPGDAATVVAVGVHKHIHGAGKGLYHDTGTPIESVAALENAKVEEVRSREYYGKCPDRITAYIKDPCGIACDHVCKRVFGQEVGTSQDRDSGGTIIEFSVTS